jgi:hypothetical protein
MYVTFLTRTFSIVTVLETIIAMFGALTASTAPLKMTTVSFRNVAIIVKYGDDGKKSLSMEVLLLIVLYDAVVTVLLRTERGLIRWKAPARSDL